MGRHFLILCTLVAVAALTTAGDNNKKLFRPDYEYNRDADGWFKLHTIPANWEDARHRCYFEGAVLASPFNNEIATVLKSMLRSRPIYVGIHATISPGDYYSVEGVPLAEMSITWAEGQPDNRDNNERCLVFANKGVVADVDCGRVFPYICFKKRTEDLVETECGTVDTTYKLDRRTGKCYKFHRNGMTWSGAMMACSAEGGHLAIINSDVEAQVIKDVFAENPASTITALYTPAASLGFYEWDERGHWGTIHGQSLEQAGYVKWDVGEPNDVVVHGKTGQCGSIIRSGFLDNTVCDVTTPFICEKDPKHNISYHDTLNDVKFAPHFQPRTNTNII